MIAISLWSPLRNDGTVPERLRNEFDLENQPEQEFLGVFRYRDGSSIQTLGPGLTEQLAFTWALPEEAVQPGQTFTLRVWKKKYTQLMATYGGKEWIDSLTDYGVTTVSVGS